MTRNLGTGFGVTRNLGTQRRVSSELEHELNSGWEMLCVEPARGLTSPAELAGAQLTWSPARVPGTVAGALRALGHDVFREPHALDAHDHWFRCRFSAPASAPGARTELRFDGLATLAEVWLNGKALLESSNMFLPASCDVSELLQADNELWIRFRALDSWLAEKRPRPHWRTRLVDHQQLRWVRTSLLGRMPGWSPPVHAVGPWRAVRLIVRAALDVLDVELRAAVERLDERTGRVNVRLLLGAQAGAIDAAELCVGDTRAALRCETHDGHVVVHGAAELASVALWWPHTHGAQPLYPVQVRVRGAGAEHVVDLGRVGFRTLALDTDGGKFALRVNGVAVFARGACWMPPDVVTLAGDGSAHDAALLAARDAGMNLLRISGTTAYESPAFYARCDELGLLVWQDFMFANMDYPIDDASFAASVADEARNLLQLTQARACLVMLCGGSEVEQQIAMLGLPRSAWQGRLFYEVLPALIAELRPDVPYWPSTPSSGSLGALPFEPNSGVSHYYGVGAYLRPIEDARRAEVKFAAECLAFANVPDEATFSSFLADGQMPVHHAAWKARVPRDVSASWDFEDVRDHYLRELFRVDPLTLRYTDLDRYLALSRVVSGELMASTFGEWRRERSTCRGGLVWFHRDLWPGAGLGLIDATGRPKAAYYYVKRALAPQCVFFSDEGLNGLALHLINEGAEPLAAELQLTLHHDSHGTVIARHDLAIDLPGRAQREHPLSTLLPWFVDTTYAYRFGPPSHDLVVARLLSRGDARVLSEAFYCPLGLPSTQSQDLGLRCELQTAEDGKHRLQLSAERFAHAVFIDVPGYQPDDNYLHVAPHGVRHVQLTALAGASEPAGRVSALNSRHAVKIVKNATLTAGT